MQSLCPDGQRDEFGFLQYANSTVTQLLERLNRVVEEGNLFDPARPSLGSELEALRHDLEALSSGPGTWESHLDRPTVSSFSLDSVARDPWELWRFLMQNLSLPNSTAQALLAARVDPPKGSRLPPQKAPGRAQEALSRTRSSELKHTEGTQGKGAVASLSRARSLPPDSLSVDPRSPAAAGGNFHQWQLEREPAATVTCHLTGTELAGGHGHTL
ncbi:ATP-binding cassette sub-family A member 2-like [Marmota marmota marmota]|uniref:ATP-binding cassette sub-family A member 2-like n=1 Tax=Marmota marmota marmota TaxID=9994 RepID=UPI0007627D3B|nr:ATP-binding cassette sub-family A member 2-like [Marmota marmota marmota]